MHLRRMCNLLHLVGMFSVILLSPSDINFYFKATVSLLTFCLDDLSIGRTGVLNSSWWLCCSQFLPFSSVQFSSVAELCPTLCDPMNRSTPGLPVHHQLPEFTETSIESVMPSSHLILCHPLFLLPLIPPSIRVFQWVNSSHEVAKVLEFQL